MATTLTLVKAPGLQKVLVLVLLTFGGLGYPPPLAEALKCYECYGVDKCQKGGEEKACEAPYDQSCAYISYDGKVGQKSCAKGDDKSFTCFQAKLGQSGQCVTLSYAEFQKYLPECDFRRRSSPGTPVNPSTVFIEREGDNAREGSERDGGSRKFQTLHSCYCKSDLCNKDAITAGGPGQRDGSKGAVIILLATKWLFY